MDIYRIYTDSTQAQAGTHDEGRPALTQTKRIRKKKRDGIENEGRKEFRPAVLRNKQDRDEQNTEQNRTKAGRSGRRHGGPGGIIATRGRRCNGDRTTLNQGSANACQAVRSAQLAQTNCDDRLEHVPSHGWADCGHGDDVGGVPRQSFAWSRCSGRPSHPVRDRIVGMEFVSTRAHLHALESVVSSEPTQPGTHTHTATGGPTARSG